MKIFGALKDLTPDQKRIFDAAVEGKSLIINKRRSSGKMQAYNLMKQFENAHESATTCGHLPHYGRGLCRKCYEKWYHLKNRERLKAKSREYHRTHKAEDREYRVKHIEERRAYEKEYRQGEFYKERERIREWARNRLPLTSESVCSVCGSKENLQRHHSKYVKDLSYVCIVCEACHQKLDLERENNGEIHEIFNQIEGHKKLCDGCKLECLAIVDRVINPKDYEKEIENAEEKKKRKLESVERIFGTLKELPEEERKKFDEAIKRRPLFENANSMKKVDQSDEKMKKTNQSENALLTSSISRIKTTIWSLEQELKSLRNTLIDLKEME